MKTETWLAIHRLVTELDGDEQNQKRTRRNVILIQLNIYLVTYVSNMVEVKSNKE